MSDLAMNEPIIERVIRRGRCHVFGDDVPVDDGIIPARFAAQRIADPQVLVPHLFESIDPDFAQRVQRGDIVIAGRNFACGKPRLQGFIALAALDISIVCASMPYKMLRRAVAQAIPVLTVREPHSIAQTEDEIEVDFASGEIVNATRRRTLRVTPLPKILHDIVASGGMRAALQRWLASHPEQSVHQP